MILLYHHICPLHSRPLSPLGDEGWSFVNTPEGLDNHIRFLKNNRYKFISLREYVSCITSTGRAPDKCIVLTFDDGWIDNYIHAAPVLLSNSVSACFFVDTDHLSKPVWSHAKMQATHLRELVAMGMEVGSHTQTHANLAKLRTENVVNELLKSREDLEKILPTDINFLAYPGGAFNKQVADMAREIGYHAACSTLGPGKNTSNSLYWLFRNVLSDELNNIRDRIVLSPILSRMLEYKTGQRLGKIVATP